MKWSDIIRLIQYAFDESNSIELSRNQLLSYLHQKLSFPIKRGELGAAIIALTVNHPNRTYYEINRNQRLSNTEFDVLYAASGFGSKNVKYQKYNAHLHGLWGICKDSLGIYGVIRISDYPCLPEGTYQLVHNALAQDIDTSLRYSPEVSPTVLSTTPSEAFLRDFIAANLTDVVVNGQPLRVYRDIDDRIGVEYATSAGIIDLLAVDTHGNYYVFEFKLNRAVDAVMGQICRYVGWVKSNLAHSGHVYGVVMGKEFSEKLLYASSAVPDIMLCKYTLNCQLRSFPTS